MTLVAAMEDVISRDDRRIDSGSGSKTLNRAPQDNTTERRQSPRAVLVGSQPEYRSTKSRETGESGVLQPGASVIFFSYWRSLAAYRVRVALALKGLPHEVRPIDIARGEHRGEAYLSVNPQAVLPALQVAEGVVLTQSLAIIEYLDETFPDPPLLPRDPGARARVRAIALVHAADTHPLLVPRIRTRLSQHRAIDDADWQRWAHDTLIPGMQTIEALLARSPETGAFCHGDAVTVADIGLASHMVAMALFGCPSTAFPAASRIYSRLCTIDAFARSHPLRQIDAPSEVQALTR